jgi:hypothetical protein
VHNPLSLFKIQPIFFIHFSFGERPQQLRMLLIGDDLAVTMGRQRHTRKQFLSECLRTLWIGFYTAAPLGGSVAAP